MQGRGGLQIWNWNYELVGNAMVEEDNVNQIYMKIVDETLANISCTCDSDDTCEDCEEKPAHTVKISDGEAVLRKRFKSDDNNDELKTSSYDVDRGGWIERDPETTQTFKRKEQVSIKLMKASVLTNIHHFRLQVCSP